MKNTFLNRLNFNNIIPLLSIQFFNKNEYSFIFSVRDLKNSLTILKNHIGFQYKLLSCISGVNLLKKKFWFSVVYEFISLTFNSRLRIKIFIEETVFVPSIVDVYINANWWEREIWDLYGIYFQNHPDLRRILTDYGFEGHPLRKDFPLSGFRELRYNQTSKTLVSEPISLSQEYRLFTYEMPW